MKNMKPPKDAIKMKTLKASAKETEKYGMVAKGETYDPRPSFSLSDKDLPEINSWNINNKYTIILEVEMQGIRKEDYGTNKGKNIANFKIAKIGVS
jgi:hypothetical protein